MSYPDFQPTLIGPAITVRPIASDDCTKLFAAGFKREGLTTREVMGATPYFIFDITKDRYQQSGRALLM